MSNNKILIIFTGGTIAMKFDSESGGLKPAVTSNELCQAVPSLQNFPIETFEFSNLPSPHFTPDTMLKLSQQVQKQLERQDIKGVVITHGTDTLEETSYFLNLVLKTDKPVVMTGAMRSSSDLSPDGPANLLNSVRVAFSEQSTAKGVMVVMNEQIHAASEVTKLHSTHVNAFSSPFWGIIGKVDQEISFRRSPYLPSLPSINFKNKTLDNVVLFKAYPGCDSLLLSNMLTSKKLKGLVIEGFGSGNVPPNLVPTIEKAVGEGIPVVLTSRTLGGGVQPIYSYAGGGKQLQQLGVILAGEPSAEKARLKLMVLLQWTSDLNQIEKYF